MASRFRLALPIVFFATNCFAVGELPVVDSSRMVSARSLYGVPPIVPKEPNREDKIVGAPTDLLIPNKPSGDLWVNNSTNVTLPPERLDYDNTFAYASRGTNMKRENASAPRPIAGTSAQTRPLAQENSKDVSGIGSAVRRSETIQQRTLPAVIKSTPRFKSVKKTAPEQTGTDTSGLNSDENSFAFNEEIPLTKLSPDGLKRAFRKTFVTENKHLSTYAINDEFDEVSQETAPTFDTSTDLSESNRGIRPLEIKLMFNEDDSALSRDNYNMLTEYAGIVVSNPKRAVQVSISEKSTRSYDGRKLAARRLAIVEQVLKDSGITDKRIIPVLSQRTDDSFVLSVISQDTFNTLSEKKRDMFGDTTSTKTYKSMSW